MKTLGIVRKIDESGRIVIPNELRNALELGHGDEVEMRCQGDTIVLRKFAPLCVFCGSRERLAQYQEKFICSVCLRNLRKV